MTSFIHGATEAGRTGPLVRLRLALERVAVWRAERRRRQEIMGDLYSLEPRDLRDLGISRYDFQAIARGSFKR